MKTITFYSYKGGVGRSLLVANTAKYLSSLGKNVFAIDLDLEAPGLHYKFELGGGVERSSASAGFVDVLTEFQSKGRISEHLGPFTTSIAVPPTAGFIKIMRAGTAPDGDYWRKLSRLNWYELFYGQNPVGVPFFLELKGLINREFQPDYLLVDARTGITEIGGAATTLLPDTVVCMGLATPEHLDGLRAVIRGIVATAENNEVNINVVPVISRLRPRATEKIEIEEIQEFIDAPLRDGGYKLAIPRLTVLHAEPLLDTNEHLLVGGKAGPHEALLLQDYLRLFSQIIPTEDIRPFVGKLIEQAVGALLDDPDAAQKELESLTTYCADLDAYRALLKLYLLRRVAVEKVLTTASMMWNLNRVQSNPERLILDVVKAAYSDLRSTEVQRRFSLFAEEVWRASDMQDARVGVNIANALLPDRRTEAVQLLKDYLDHTAEVDHLVVTRLVEILAIDRTESSALEIVQRYKSVIDAAEFHVSWARLIVNRKQSQEAQDLLNDDAFRSELVRVTDPIVMYKTLKLAGVESAHDYLLVILEAAMVSENTGQLRMIGEIFYDEGSLDEFEYRLSNRFPSEFVEEMVETAKRRTRRSRFARPSVPSFVM